MQTLTITTPEIKQAIAKLTQDGEPVIICGEGEQRAALVSLDDLGELNGEIVLAPEVEAQLDQDMADIKAGRTQAIPIEQIGKELGYE